MKHFKIVFLPALLIIVLIGVRTLFRQSNLLTDKELNELGQFFFILNTVLITWLILAGVRAGKHLLLGRFDVETEDNLTSRKVHTHVSVLENIAIFVILIVAIGIMLLSFESLREVGLSLFASAGLAGVIIGLAAQKAIGTVLAGLQIAITQPIRLGDAVIVENEWGWIEEITLTYVVVRIWDKRRLVVPSTYFIEKPFQNWTRTSADILGTVFIHTDYTMPFEPLRQELGRLLKSTPLWDGNVNVMQVTDAKAHTVEIRCLMSAKNSPTAWDLRVYVREKLIEFIQKNYPESLPKTRVKLQQD